jgi:hypothetical protein
VALDEARYEPVMLFLNHSRDPNVGFARNIVLGAMRDINPGDELTTNYALFDDCASTCVSQACARRCQRRSALRAAASRGDHTAVIALFDRGCAETPTPTC